MVRHALDGHAGVDDTAYRTREIAARWIPNREMVEARMARAGGTSAAALPGVQTDVMMIATCRYERCVIAEPHDLVETQHARIKRERAIDIGDLQMHWPIPVPAGA